MVLDIRILGNKALPYDKIFRNIRTRVNRPFDLQMIQEDVRRLDNTHMFVDVKTYFQQVDGGRVVFFEVLERPLLKEVLFVGCAEIHKKVLQKEAEIKVGDAVDPFVIEEARRKLEEFYHKKGFIGAHITLLEGDKPQDRRAVFLVNEGVKQKVWNVNFVGNTIADDGRLRTQIKSKSPFLYLFGGELDRKQLEEDKERLTAYYRGLGFFHARISEPVFDYNESKNWVTITFVIDEGARFKIRNVSVIGNTKFPTESLLEKLKLKNSDYFNQDQMTMDVRSLQDKYGCVGYVFADVKADPRFLEQPGQLDLIYHIKEGSRYRVGKINVAIKGEYPHTQMTTVLNRLSIKPGDIVDIRQVRESERRVKLSGLFENKPGGGAPKIVFSPPGQEELDEEEGSKKSQMAERPGGRSRGPGHGPDPQTRSTWYPPSNGRQTPPEQEVNLTVDCSDCGRYVGPREPLPPQAIPVQPTTSLRAASQPAPWQSTFWQPAPQAPASVAPAAIVRCQSPDAGQAVSLRDLQNGGELSRTQDPLSKALSDLTNVISPRRREPAAASNWQLQYVQYSPDAGQSTPALSRPANQWTAIGATPVGVGGVTTTQAASAPQTSAGSAWNAAGAETSTQPAPVQPAPPYGQSYPQNSRQPLLNAPNGNYDPGPIFAPDSPFNGGQPDGPSLDLQAPLLDFSVMAEEAMTGRIMFGVGINSDSGLVGQATIDEQNFDWTRFPTSWEDVRNGTAFRGAGQHFRLEAMPGTQVSRYSVSFQEPYLFNTPVALGLSGFYYTRIFYEYTDQRFGGRISLGYAFTHDLTGSVAYDGEKINISNPIDPALPALAEVVNRDLAMHKFSVSLSYDKRDSQFLATEGYFVEGTMSQVLGSFEYGQAGLDLRKYFSLHERPDGSGRHVLTLAARAAWTGDNTPIYDRYYAGGFSSLRGFAFRGVSPTQIGPSTGDVIHVGGDFELLASAEYMFPITADDMLRAVVFCDTGTVEPTINQWNENYRVAPGFGLRIAIPAMGPAPIALDFAFPVASQKHDTREMFSFFIGLGR
jgi:outer membrane protein insertion porin family